MEVLFKPDAASCIDHGIDSPLEYYIPHYQPILNVASGNIAGYESLARRQQKDGSVVSAAGDLYNTNLPTQTRLEIDRHLREAAIAHFATQPDGGFLSLNISPDWVDLLDRNSAIPTIEMIRNNRLSTSRVIIEFTERSGDLKNLKRLAKAYHRAGISVAIDDFGVGGSQVDRIIALGPDFIKLDMHLFKLASKGGPEADVVLSIAAIAQRAGCKIICEGVETESEFHFALECGADYIQGWLFSPAMAGIIPKSTFTAKINALKRSYLSRKSQMHTRAAVHNREVAAQVEKICQLIQQKASCEGVLAEIDFATLLELGILRVYICDQSGEQISPNYEMSNSGFQANHHAIGCNWSHRPYFPLLNAMYGMNANHIVVSNPYKDAMSGAICKTLGTFVSKERAVLVDVQSNDEVLFLKKTL